MGQLVTMTYDECRRALNQLTVGRVAVTTDQGPYIVPVNYVAVNERVLFRTPSFSVLGTHARGQLAAFQVDVVEPADETGWSVLARGHTELVTDPAEIAWFDSVVQPRPWATDREVSLYSLRWHELSGRRILMSTAEQSAPNPLADPVGETG